MSENTRLSPMTSYYLRKFIDDRQDTLHALLPDLHGEITLDQLFNRISQQQQDINKRISVIESLVEIHKQVLKTAPPASTEVQNLDKRLLASLGAVGNIPEAKSGKSSVSVAQDCVKILNTLRTQALFYLGDKIGTKYLLETRPNDEWCQKFKIAPKTTVTYEGPLTEGLKPEQISYFETWINQFSDRCGTILDAFDQNENEALFDNI